MTGKVFGTLTSEPQRGKLVYRDGREGESGWYRLDLSNLGVLFKPLYGREWIWHCYTGFVAQFVIRRRFRG